MKKQRGKVLGGIRQKRWLLIDCAADSRVYCRRPDCPGICYEQERLALPSKRGIETTYETAKVQKKRGTSQA
jgi:hypothetical protein